MAGCPRRTAGSEPARLRPGASQQAPGFSAQNWLKSAPPESAGVVGVGVGVVGAGVPVPPVLEGGVAGGVGVGVTAVPPVEDGLGVVAVVDVVVVDVVLVEVPAAGVVVPPDGGAVSTGTVSGTL